MSQLFTNNASGTLSVQLEIVDTTLTLQAGEATLFPPAVTGGDFAMATIEDVNGFIEIVKITNRDVGTDVLTITRGQENTSAKQFVTGSRVELRVTAATFGEFIQRSGGTMTGTLNMDNQSLTDPVITGGEARNLTLRGTDGGSSNQLVVPTNGGAPTIGSQPIYTPASLPEANRIDHTAVTITAGSGLGYSVGGDDISASATIDIDLTGLTTIEGSLLAATDSILVNDDGINKAIEIQEMGLRVKVSRPTTDTLVAGDMNSILKYTSSSLTTLTLPLNASIPLPLGVPVVLNVQHATQVLKVQAASGVILVSVFHPAGDSNASDNVRAGGSALLYKTAINTWALTGDLAD
jgi:hypothetical protein